MESKTKNKITTVLGPLDSCGMSPSDLKMNEINRNIEKKIGDKLKTIEKKWEGKTINPNYPFIIRADGHHFSKFTKNEDLEKPCDHVFTKAIINSCKDALDEFQARTIFTESDEITLIFDKVYSTNKDGSLHSHIYNGRPQKICSLVAGFLTARFNYYYSILSKKKELTDFTRAFFDARVFQCENSEEVHDAVWWRYHYDTFRNGVNCLGHHIFTQKEMFKKNPFVVIEMLKDEKKIDINDYPNHLLFGTFIKKEQYNKNAFNPKLGKVSVKRSRIIPKSGIFFKKMDKKERTDFLIRKFW